MKVIIFTMAYNAEKTLPRTIDSILNQTFQNFEYYILNNASEDDTKEVLQKYAALDRRIVPLEIDRNNPQNGGMIFWALAHATDAGYIVWCDADDTYSPDFLEKMTAFADHHQLDIAVCGYDMIDGATGAVLKHRALTENMVIQGGAFTDDFIKYRGFMPFLWGKLYSTSFFKYGGEVHESRKYKLCGESIWVMSFFQAAKRVGIYAEAMYQYYQYPNSLSNTRVREGIKSYVDHWEATKRYLESYGPISRLNEDFLYAIYLSFADESAERIFRSALPAEEKLDLLRLTFAEPLWAETLAREADPQFRNLAARREYVAGMKKRILALAATPDQQVLAEKALRELEKPIAGGLV